MPENIKVHLVEDDHDVRLGIEQALKIEGLDVEAFAVAERVRSRITPDWPGVMVCDVRLPGMDGLQLLDHVMSIDVDIPVILITGHGDIAMAVQAMRKGAYDFIEKPFSSEHLVGVVKRAVEKRRLTLEVRTLRGQLDSRRDIEATILGRSPAIESLRRKILDLADTSADVLIYGETGTGKELVARCLHEHGKRSGGKLVALNCGGLPETLLESELFGHEAGAFTNAMKRRIGKIEYADRGTLFLDEIESMPPAVQIKLLRVLQERQIERLGSNESIRVDCRVVAASKTPLSGPGAQAQFRQDLYYRLGVAILDLPPLRERREDIPLLLEQFILQAAIRYNRDAPIISNAQMSEMMAYSWPGNVRELRNVADRLVLGLMGGGSSLLGCRVIEAMSFAEQVDQFERCLIEEALRRHRGHAAAASETLGLPKKTLYDKMRRFHLLCEEFR